jgi:hypothetical protein
MKNNNNNHYLAGGFHCSAGNDTRALHVSDSPLAQYPDTSGGILQQPHPSSNFNLISPFDSMLNPALPPFIPLRSNIPAPLHPAHVYKKRYRLYMFPFITRFQRLTGSQSARIRIMRKPLVQRLKQLKLCAKLLEQSKSVSKDLNLLQFTFANIAEQVHHIQVAANHDTEPPPPFDGYTYIWTWKGISIRFCGSNTFFRISFDFSRYIDPACAEYVFMVY